MIPLWYQGLSDYFHEKFDKQEFVDVIFRCYDGVVGGHQLLLSLSSRFMFRVFAENERLENEIVIIAPDLSVRHVSMFLAALCGGPLPTHDEFEFRSFAEVLHLFCVELTPRPDLDPMKVATAGYLDDGYGDKGVLRDPVKLVSNYYQPKFVAKSLPTNAQLLHLSNSYVPPTATADTQANSNVQMMQLLQDPSGSFKLVQISNDDVDAIQPQHFLDMDKTQARKRGPDGEGENFGTKKKRRGKARSKDPGSQHAGGAKTMVICSICRKTFTKRVFQIYHKAKCPGSIGELICDYCNETGFDSVNILSVHVRVSHMDEPKPYLCGYCPARFSTGNGRSGHRALKHGVLNGNKKEWPCEECGKRLTSKVKLLAHIKVVHRGEKGYCCSFCPRTFSTKFNQLTHEGLKHTGEKLYRCDSCNTTFDRKALLREHVDNFCPNAPKAVV